MKSMIRDVTAFGVTYQCLMFCCPGCIEAGKAKGATEYQGLHTLPVNVTVKIDKPSWTFDGNTDCPTLSPSILTQGGYGRCHSYLENGVFRFLDDCDHSLAGQTNVPMPDLPDWAIKEITDG